jgi:hypothetical protein
MSRKWLILSMHWRRWHAWRVGEENNHRERWLDCRGMPGQELRRFEGHEHPVTS